MWWSPSLSVSMTASAVSPATDRREEGPAAAEVSPVSLRGMWLRACRLESSPVGRARVARGQSGSGQ